MRIFARLLIFGGTTLFIVLLAYVSLTGGGLRTMHNRSVIKAASQDCPGQKDEYGNCLEASYRSAYYRNFYFDNSSYGRGK